MTWTMPAVVAAVGHDRLDSIAEAAETENWLYKLRDAGFLKKERLNARIREATERRNALNGLIRNIQNPNTERPFSGLCALCVVRCAQYSVLCTFWQRRFILSFSMMKLE